MALNQNLSEINTEVKQDTYDLLKDDANDSSKEETVKEDLLADDKPKEEEEEEEENYDDVKEKESDNEIELDSDTDVEIDADELANDVQLQTPIKIKEILAKYPNIKKEFPELFAANYREQKYAEILPTIDDAKLAVERSETLQKFEQTLFSGETAPVLDIIKKEDPTAFGKIVDNYLPTLQKIDSKAYYHVIGGVLRQLAMEMFQSGATNNNDDLKTAAQIVHRYVFNSDNDVMPKSFGNADNKETVESNKIKDERAAFEKEKFTTVSNELNSRTDNLIKSTINNNIDPKDMMSAYVKKNAVNDCLTQVKDLIKADVRFNKIIDGMWKKAAEQKYDSSIVDQIRKAILGKAKSVLREAIQKTRTEALKGSSTVTKQRDSANTVNRGQSTVKRETTSKSGNKTEQPNRRLSTLELLNKD